MTSTADVIIHVGDENDNPPTFDRHPSSPMNTTYLVSTTNTTYLVSTRAHRGYVITRVRTSDADSGVNARVTFQLADVAARDSDGSGSVSASGSGLFHVDRELGIVKVDGDLSERDGVTFDLIVVAMDGGEPPMSAFATVSIAVNSSVVDVPMSGAGADRRRSVVIRQNLLVVVALAVVSGLITVCLVVAIVFIRRGDHRRRRKPGGGAAAAGVEDGAARAKERKYNLRMECATAADAQSHDEPLQSAPLSIYNGIEKTCEPEITSYCAEQESKMRLSSQVFRPNYRVCKHCVSVFILLRNYKNYHLLTI